VCVAITSAVAASATGRLVRSVNLISLSHPADSKVQVPATGATHVTTHRSHYYFTSNLISSVPKISQDEKIKRRIKATNVYLVLFQQDTLLAKK